MNHKGIPVQNIHNPHDAKSTSLVSLICVIKKNHQLMVQLITREVMGRYKGSIFGLAWSFINPVLMLTIYTFVFSVVLKVRWTDSDTVISSKSQVAILLFIGMIVQGFFSEVINRAPSLILTNANYVKKVIFPLEILSMVSVGVALFHVAISFIVLVISLILINGNLNWTAIFLPLIITPFIMLVLGLSWGLATLGVFVRDVAQGIGMITAVLLFMSPVFYPLSAIPKQYQNWIMLNPLTFIIEQSRSVLIFGEYPNWKGLCVYTLAALAIMMFGYAWFQKTRKNFSDVI